MPTDREQLDLLDRHSWEASFGPRRADAFLCEHVWEYLTEAEGRAAARLGFDYLKPGGFLRCAVPDANFPDPNDRAAGRVGGPGPACHPAADHRIVYEYRRFSDVRVRAGCDVDLLEYCDESGRFHDHQGSLASGPISRSLLMDHRTRAGRLGFVSLMLDAKKPNAGPNR